MPRKTQPVRPSLGYSLVDVLAWTTATKSNLQHWLTTGVIAADVLDVEGRGLIGDSRRSTWSRFSYARS